MTDHASNRREFLKQSGVAGLGLAALATPALAAAADKPAADKASAKAAGPATKPTAKAATKPAKVIKKVAKSDKPIGIAIIGSSDRGTSVGITFAESADAVVRLVCDVDAKKAAAAAKAIGQYQDSEPATVDDLRRVLDDKSIDAVVIATPDHWHAPAAILACQAGKHVYVEKPCSHNPAEGELLVAVAAKHNRLVQHGTQRRSWPGVVEAIERVKSGEIGPVLLSRGWYNNTRKETGKRTPIPVPTGLNWDLWQGPAPRVEFTDNVVHYKWHWYWQWGTGELGNNGVHALDVCRWGLGVADHPRRVTAGGGRYHFKDDQETPDTLSVTYDYGDKAIFWEGRSCHPRGFEGSGFGVAFYGEKATMVIDGGGYTLLDSKGKPMLDKPVTGPAGNTEHVENFLQAIAGKAKLNCPIEEGAKTALICHLGNMAYRTGRAINCDPKTGHVVGDAEAAKLWTRAYDPNWTPKA
jgi:predicted dehydrogenase